MNIIYKYKMFCILLDATEKAPVISSSLIGEFLSGSYVSIPVYGIGKPSSHIEKNIAEIKHITMFALTLLLVGALLLAVATAAQNATTTNTVVPSLRLCDYEDCPTVSRIGMGALHLGDKISGLTSAADINAWIQQALSFGINLFDLADVYPVKGGDQGTSAELFGQALAMTPGLREQITIVAKMDIIFPSSIDTSVEHLSQTLEWYLQVLQTSHVDILLLHYSDSFMDADAVSQFFVDMKAAGKVKFFGVSNHFPSKFDLLQARLDVVSGGDIKLVTHEFEASVWNPSYMNYNSELVDHAYRMGLRPLAWSSMGGDPVGGLNRLFVRKGERQNKILRSLKSVGDDMGIADESVVALTW